MAAGKQYKRFAGQSVNNASYHNENWDRFHGGNELRDVAFDSFAEAVTDIGTGTKTLYITTQHRITSNTKIPANISVVMLKGGGFDIASGVTLTINGPFKAGLFRVFTGSGAAAFNSNPYLDFVRPEWWGAAGNDSTLCGAAFNAAGTAFPDVRLASGTYILDSEFNTLQSGGTLTGLGKHRSIVKATTLAAGNSLIMIRMANKSNWSIRNLGLHGNTANYPDDTSAIPKIVAGINASLSFPVIAAIRAELTTSLGTDTIGVNCTVEDCHFQYLSDSSVRFAPPGGTDSWREIDIINNTAYKGSYQEKVFSVVGLNSSEAGYARNIRVNNNTTRRNSVTKYLRIGQSGMNSSTDAIEINKCKNFECLGNIVDQSAGCGLRIESSENGTVDIAITDAGQNGINVYNSCKDISIRGSIKRWGKIPNFGCMRKFDTDPGAGVTYVNYIARETPGPYNGGSPTVTFPADPSASTWWEANPYYLQGVSEDTIPVYDTANYYNEAVAYSGNPNAVPPTGFGAANAQGVLPFRGYSGIEVSQFSERITIDGVTIVGDKTQTGGKYNYASDYGISTVHSSNDPQNYNSPIILGTNFITGCIKREVYQPGYVDPINRQGAIDGVKYFPNQVGLKSTSATNENEPVELFPSLYENILHSETIPSLTFGTGGYYKMLGAGRPAIGTGGFGLFMFVRFTTALGSTAQRIFDAGVGGAATIGFRVSVKATEINFSCTDGSNNFEVKYQTVQDWGAGDNKVLLLYACRDATTGLLRLNVNGVEKAAAGPSPTVDLDTGNDIGIGADSNGASGDIPFELFKCVMWSGTFTAQEIAERIYQKRLIRNGDTVLMDLDMKTCGTLLLDKASSSRTWVSSGTAVTSSDPYLFLPKPIHVNTTVVGNVGVGEDDLMTYTVPARLLSTNGDSVRLKAYGTFAANANNKRVRAYFGSDLLFDTTALAFNAGDWSLEVEITRTGATTQKAIAVWACGNTTVTAAPVDYTAPGRTLSSTNVLKLTGEATSNDDIQQQAARVFYEPA